MPFKIPQNAPLTESQNKALSKLNALRAYINSSNTKLPSLFSNAPKSEQISAYDLAIQFLSSIAGKSKVDEVLKQFLNKIFDVNGEDKDLLENIIIDGLAKSLDANNINLAPQNNNNDNNNNTNNTNLENNVSSVNLVGDLIGNVFDENNQPIIGAKVVVKESFSNILYELLTDLNGNYEFLNLPQNEYDITVSYDGVSNIQKQVSNFIIESNRQNLLDFQLNFSVNNINDNSLSINNSNTNTVRYTYQLIGRPVNYIYTHRKNPSNVVDDNDVTSIFLSIENDVNLPNAEVEIFKENNDDDYWDLIDTVEQYKLELENEGKVIDGVFYPKKNYNLHYTYEVYNNIDLVPYEEVVVTNNGINDSEDLIEESFRQEKVINQVTYPPVGTEFVVTEEVNEFGQTTISEYNIVPDEQQINEQSNNSIPSGSIDISPNGEEVFQINSFSSQDLGLTNKQFLVKYLKPVLSTGKRVLVAQIIKMLFGPKDKINSNPQTAEMLLNSVACGEKLFSTTNNPSITEQELEYNRLVLKKQLEKGKIELTVSCQKVIIELPEDFENQFNLVESEKIGIPESQRPNPAISFTLVENYVNNEVKRQRNDEDSNAVSKSFFEIILEKIFQYISVSFSVNPSSRQAFAIVNSALSLQGKQPITPQELLSSPCEITNACSSGNKEEFEKKSSFSRSIINSLYALLLSMLITILISEAKRMIKKLIAEKAKEKILKLIRRRKRQFEQLQNVSNNVSKAAQYSSTFKSSGLSDVFNYRNNNEEQS
jgi:hypothetical protein